MTKQLAATITVVTHEGFIDPDVNRAAQVAYANWPNGGLILKVEPQPSSDLPTNKSAEFVLPDINAVFRITHQNGGTFIEILRT